MDQGNGSIFCLKTTFSITFRKTSIFNENKFNLILLVFRANSWSCINNLQENRDCPEPITLWAPETVCITW